MAENELQAVHKVLNALQSAGFEAYLVGGAVRDELLGLRPKDYDVATNARPHEMEEVMKEIGGTVYDTGREFGRLGVGLDSVIIDVTTFRSDEYSGYGHRPEKVTWTSTLREDLSRRDFTINALAKTKDGQVIDYFGGQADLKAKVLRTVGPAKLRFQEDPLRLLRAVRFAASLDFTWQADLAQAVAECFSGVATLASERVFAEIRKIVLGSGAAYGIRLMTESGLLAQVCQGRSRGLLETVRIWPEWIQLSLETQERWLQLWQICFQVMPPSIVYRYALLLLPVFSPEGSVSSFDLSRREQKEVHNFLDTWYWACSNEPFLLKLLQGGYERGLRQHLVNFTDWTKYLPDRLWPKQAQDRVAKLLSRPCEVAELALSGQELAGLIGNGPQVRQKQYDLLLQVSQGILPNDHEVLLQFV